MVDIDACSPPAHPDPSSISPDAWRRFETAALAVVHKIQPTVSSQHLRAAIIDYVQRLFRFNAGCEVFPFGSVPLKTYLPDGDIDLSTFGSAISDENLANEVHAILLSEEQSKSSEFEVKDVQLINAEVKLVKCLVQNIAVDISFNQIGGLYTLCFLEKVDKQFGKNHLFKRSIILIKDWCYYESRILGAHHGLISTYALEILVLYIFHIFHKSLDGPLAVLYRFLDYYSKFDWDNKGISLFGPVFLSSLPELVTDPPNTHDDGFILREELLKECAKNFSIPTRKSEKSERPFAKKFLNIVDPLKQSNNLGRSVSQGNFYRIRSAFDFGARKLGKVLQVPNCSTVSEVNQFFRNTLKRNHTGFRPDILLTPSDDGIRTNHVTNNSSSRDLDVERVSKGSSPFYSSSHGDLSNQFSNINISHPSNHASIKQNEHNSTAEHKVIKAVSSRFLDSDATSHASIDSASLRNHSDFCESSPTASETCALSSERLYCAPNPFHQSENGKMVDFCDDPNPPPHGMSTKQFSGRSHHSFEDSKYNNGFSGSSSPLFGHPTYSSPASLVDGVGKTNSFYTSENSQGGGTINDVVLDLDGDFNANLNHLLFAQGYQQDNPTNQFYYQMMPPPPPPAQYRSTSPALDHGRKNPYRYAGMNGAVPGPPYSPGCFVLRPFHQTDDQMAMRARGTGTYFPDPNMRKDMPPGGRGERGRHNFPPNNYQKFHHYVRTDMPTDMIPLEELRQEIPPPFNRPVPSPSSRSPRDPSKLPAHAPSSQVRRGFHGNGLMLPQDSKHNFGTLGALPVEVTTSNERASRSDFGSNNEASGPVIPISPADKTVTGYKQTRNPTPYHLKDSSDFPPLSS
ncbi:hypothetical protein EJB05_23525 [Eragrostis curvula]|uniref:PAP-associated domain-containing protein n=1 Tax=Eragrostis curvula TaxID=38414 RepID=A0A5J9V8K3_9POAL|nr:hypothetical protein EJB05_23525 [Eragrostis curvula]